MTTTFVSPLRSRSLRTPAAGIAAAAVAGLALLLVLLWPSSSGQSGAMPTSSAIEQQYGVRFTLAGVSADGGLVDVRFVVLDADKALEMLESESSLPVLVTERNDKALPSAAMLPMEHELTAGHSYDVLYRNTDGAVRSGDMLAFVFPDMRLSHVPAR